MTLSGMLRELFKLERSGTDVCRVRQCGREPELAVGGVPLCWRHWVRLCDEFEKRVEKRAD